MIGTIYNIFMGVVLGHLSWLVSPIAFIVVLFLGLLFITPTVIRIDAPTKKITWMKYF